MSIQRPIKDTKKLALLANTIRQDIVTSLHKAGSGHPGGSLGMADVFTVLYFHTLKHDPKKPLWEKRDRVVLSNGHICPVLYATLAHAGYFPLEELYSLRKLGARAQGHPHRGALPGLETTSGPLGSGLSQACGMALAAKMDKQKHSVVALTSDGEHQEGNHWEAVLLAAKYKLDNIVQIIDRNYIQIDGRTEEVMPLDSLQEKYNAFHWNVLEVNGHKYEDMMNAIVKAKTHTGSPTVIIANTTPGKGVSFMEDRYDWHGKAPNDDELKEALQQLRGIREQIQKGTYDY